MISKLFSVIPLMLLVAGCGSFNPAVNSAGIDLDAAVREAAREMETGIPPETMVTLVSHC